jgi:anti-anti-sigma factor
MADEDVAIPLAGHLDGSDLAPAGLAARTGSEARPKTSLEAERLGLLSGPGTAVAPDRRMENWIASQLDLEVATPAAPANVWNRIIDGLPGLRKPARNKPTSTERVSQAALEGWTRFLVAYRHGITVVRLLDRALVREAQIQEFASDLLDLVEAGNHRMILNFQAVERLASWVVVAVCRAQKLCAAADGGALKICGLRSHLAAVLPIAGVDAQIAAYAGENEAIESPWPVPSGPRPLPLEILTALLSTAHIPPVRGGAPVLAEQASEGASIPPLRGGAPAKITGDPSLAPARQATPAIQTAPRAEMARPRRPPAELSVCLKVQVGTANARVVPVATGPFVIGREATCQLRLGSPMVSKRHAVLETRGQLVFLRDLDSTNGTILNGRPFHGGELPLQNGDRFQIGPVVCTLQIGASGRGPEREPAEELIADWLQPAGLNPRCQQLDAHPTLVAPAAPADPAGDSEPAHRIKVDVIQDVLVVTPQSSALDDDETIELLRTHLHALFDQPVPRQVVVNLEYIGHLSGHAIGVLLAHHLRLDHAAGALRICHARARIMAVLHQVHLTLLVECYPTLDEAVLSAWPSATAGQRSGEDARDA